MAVSLIDLELALDFVSQDPFGNEAFLDRQSGHIYWHSESGDNFEELPEDIEDETRYVKVPSRRDLDLGKPLVLDFVRQFLPDEYDEVRWIFSRKGAYGRFKDLLIRRKALDRWHSFSNEAEKVALKAWCAENAIELSE
jgi:hypothetical protein